PGPTASARSAAGRKSPRRPSSWPGRSRGRSRSARRSPSLLLLEVELDVARSFLLLRGRARDPLLEGEGLVVRDEVGALRRGAQPRRGLARLAEEGEELPLFAEGTGGALHGEPRG